MKKKIIAIFLVVFMTIIYIGMASAYEDKNIYLTFKS